MPYCSKCGSEVDAESVFCRQCGAPIDKKTPAGVYTPPISSPAAINNNQPGIYTPITSPGVYQQKDLRTECLDELDRMIKYFGKKQRQYDEHDHCCEQIEYYSNPRSRVYITESTGKPFKIIGIIAMVIGGIMGEFASCTASIARNPTYNYNNSYSSAAAAAVFWVIVFLIGGALLATGIVKSVKYGNRMRAERERLLRENKKKLSDLEKELSDYYNKYGKCLTGLAYTNPLILKEIRKVVYTGRADSIKEAINLLLQDTHNSEMEYQATLTAQHAANAAHSARTAAIFTAADFFLKK